jgi:hypothetical protein
VSRLLRVLGWLVLLGGLAAAAVAAGLYAGDTGFDEIAAAYARHRDNPVFEVRYWAAALRHYGFLAGAVAGAAATVTCAAVLLGLGEILRRLPPR